MRQPSQSQSQIFFLASSSKHLSMCSLSSAGRTESAEKGKYGENCSYRNGAIDIVYIAGKADWITYNDPPHGFYPAIMLDLGVNCPVDPRKITVALDRGSFRWDGTCSGLVSASVFAGGGNAPAPNESFRKVWYIYIKAATN